MTRDGAASRLHIRPGMDVYSSYQDEYIGSVIRVAKRSTDADAPDPERPHAPDQIPLVHEEGHQEEHATGRGSRILGEEIGPGPTIAVGNTGPVRQSADRRYATNPEAPLPDVVYFVVRPGRLNLGPLTRPLYIPTDAVESVSMERIVLDVQRSGIPSGWRKAPLHSDAASSVIG
jgi:hypothetical protein